MDIKQLLKLTLERKASDLHLSTGLAPTLRVDGDLIRLEQAASSASEVLDMIRATMSPEQFQKFTDTLELDYAYALDNARFRVNAFYQHRGAGSAFRFIPDIVPTLQDLGFSNKLERLCEFRNGLVLVTGPTGSGKSTSLAAMVNYINLNHAQHIITVEDPIEYVHTPQKCLINQREVHRDTRTFQAALRSALREDPDVILVGEMRDLETVRLALSAAETGHLVFATLHTNSASETIDRIIDLFPEHEKGMVRSMLAESLRAVIAQTLVKRKTGGRIAALELMLGTAAIRNLIRENKVPQIFSIIQTGQSVGMHTLEQNLGQLVRDQLIDKSILAQFKDITREID